MMLSRGTLSGFGDLPGIITQAQQINASPFTQNNPSFLNTPGMVLSNLEAFCNFNPGTGGCIGNQVPQEYIDEANNLLSTVPAPLLAAAAAGQTTPLNVAGTTTENNPGPVLYPAPPGMNCAPDVYNAYVGGCVPAGQGQNPNPVMSAPPAQSGPSVSHTVILPTGTTPPVPVSIQPTQQQINNTTPTPSPTGTPTVPDPFAWFSQTSFGSIPNWALVAGGVGALFLLPMLMGGRR